MHDVKDICARPEFYKGKLSTRMKDADTVIDTVISLEKERVRVAKEVEQLKTEINKISVEISLAKRAGRDCTEMLEYAATLKKLMPMAERGELGKWIDDLKKEVANNIVAGAV